jgi:hypothetical protein
MDDKTSDLLGALIDKVWPVGQIYKDAFQPAAQQLGKAGEDLAKSLRLATLPVQGLAMLQDKIDGWRARLNAQVPEERRIPIHPRLGAPIVEGLRFAEDGDLVTEFMLNLLAAAMDKQKVGDFHPAFATIARDLAPDEAMILYRLKRSSYRMRMYRAYLPVGAVRPGDVTWGPLVSEENEFPLSELGQPEYFSLFMDRLKLLGIAHTEGFGQQEPILEEKDGTKRQTGIRIYAISELTDLGKLFARACVPDELPANTQHRSP